ncbi:TRAP transporter small permease subunit [Arhodomonas sp. AD133]|uniref:TRAP transporter small permease subunit n=1 Tax=Arhodomonas sp. AD133 TaxID=3415009 RepID=UPI003EBDB387
MPGIDFVLPHWLYWCTLVAFPLIAMALVVRERRHGPPASASYPVAYLLWLTGGFVGLHRFYLGSLLGAGYIVLFVAVLVGNVHTRDARLALSEANNDIVRAEFLLERAVERQGENSQAAVEAQQDLTQARRERAVARDTHQRAGIATGAVAGVIAVLLLIDAVRIPPLVRRQARVQRKRPASEAGTIRGEQGPPPAPEGIWGRITAGIDQLSGFTGHFVAYWSLIAVFVYYYEVIARYVFNSPTNWAHEAMFLMFGMQYVLGGAFTLREDGHVRVDVLYQYLPRRGQAVLDIITSVFFFIFVGAMLWTGWHFARNSMMSWEVSFTEWAIQYWVVKLAIPLGALLVLLQGFAKLVRDIATVARG